MPSPINRLNNESKKTFFISIYYDCKTIMPTEKWDGKGRKLMGIVKDFFLIDVKSAHFEKLNAKPTQKQAQKADTLP